jgi:xanthine dehydrogenase small subunit
MQVLVGDLTGDGIEYKAVNACIRFLPTVDGKSVVTVDGVKSSEGPHPVQQAMVDCHGSQCGFCTPGIVMSLLGAYLERSDHSRPELIRALSGNLCRCTGYRPILEAGARMSTYPAPARWSREDAQSPERKQQLQSISRTKPLELDTAPGYAAPQTLNDFAARYAAQPNALILAGGTDVGLWVTKHFRDLPPLLYIGDVTELKTLHEHDGWLDIGAAVTLENAYAALTARYPMIADFADRFASVPIRNSGTLCGNLANGSPIGDSMPLLIVLGAKVILRKSDRIRELPLEDLYLGYQKKALESGEFVASVRIPLPRPNVLVATYKVAKRHDQDISAVCGAYCLELASGWIQSARIAYGGMAATPKRATRAEASLFGQPWSETSIDAAMAAMAQDYHPISDMRASGKYRARVAANLLKRFYLEHRSGRFESDSGVFAGIAS